MSISKKSDRSAPPPAERLPAWARAVLPPANDGEWAVVVRTNLSIRSFADLHGVDRAYMRKLVEAGRVFLVRHLQEMTTLELARHTGYSPTRIKRMVRGGVLPPLYRRANGEPIFLEDQLPQAPDNERWKDPMRQEPYNWARDAAAMRRILAIRVDSQDDWNERVRAAQAREKAERAANRRARDDARKAAQAQAKQMRELMGQARLAQGKAAPRAKGRLPSEE